MEAARQHRRELADHHSGHRKKEPSSVLLPKQFNLDTSKFHALGDYVSMICMFGTTGSFTTQVVH